MDDSRIVNIWHVCNRSIKTFLLDYSDPDSSDMRCPVCNDLLDNPDNLKLNVTAEEMESLKQ